MVGFGNGFVIKRHDNTWQYNIKDKGPDLNRNILHQKSLLPVLQHVRTQDVDILSHEVDLLVTVRLLSRERNLRDQGFGVSLSALPPELTGLS